VVLVRIVGLEQAVCGITVMHAQRIRMVGITRIQLQIVLPARAIALAARAMIIVIMV